MDMRRPIPTVAVASLSLVGCNDDRGANGPEIIDDGQVTRAEIERAFAISCRAASACDPALSAADCREYGAYVIDYLVEDVEEDPEYADCVDALLTYAVCVATTGSCVEYEYDGYAYFRVESELCDAEYESFMSRCDSY